MQSTNKKYTQSGCKSLLVLWKLKTPFIYVQKSGTYGPYYNALLVAKYQFTQHHIKKNQAGYIYVYIRFD